MLTNQLSGMTESNEPDWPGLNPVSSCDLDDDFAGPDALEDGDGLRVREAVGRVPVDREDFVTCEQTWDKKSWENFSSGKK